MPRPSLRARLQQRDRVEVAARLLLMGCDPLPGPLSTLTEPARAFDEAVRLRAHELQDDPAQHDARLTSHRRTP